MRNKTIIYSIFILSFFLCHSGVCSTVLEYFSQVETTESSGCHEMMEADTSGEIKFSFDSHENSKECCLDSISSPKETELKTYFSSATNFSFFLLKSNGSLSYREIQSLNKGHPRPNLYLQKSSFII